jgi:hypothetical protein
MRKDEGQANWLTALAFGSFLVFVSRARICRYPSQLITLVIALCCY